MSAPDPVIRPETAADADEVSRLVGLAFGGGHPARNIWQLRRGGAVREICMVAESGDGDGSGGGSLAGSCRYWPVTIAGVASLLLGPLAVDPALRGRGIGRRLVRDSLGAARRAGKWRWCFISGEPQYYLEFGFVKIAASDIDVPAPIEDERLHLLDFTADVGTLGEMPARPWVIRAGGGDKE